MMLAYRFRFNFLLNILDCVEQQAGESPDTTMAIFKTAIREKNVPQSDGTTLVETIESPVELTKIEDIALLGDDRKFLGKVVQVEQVFNDDGTNWWKCKVIPNNQNIKAFPLKNATFKGAPLKDNDTITFVVVAPNEAIPAGKMAEIGESQNGTGEVILDDQDASKWFSYKLATPRIAGLGDLRSEDTVKQMKRESAIDGSISIMEARQAKLASLGINSTNLLADLLKTF